MAWIELHQSLPTHRKTLALCDALKVEPAQAVGHLACLWLWALDNAQPDGFLMGASPRTVARAAGWKKDPVLFMDALVDAGFVEGSKTIHNWSDYAGKLVDQRELRRSSNRDAQARRRQRLRGDPSSGVIADSADVTADVSADAPLTVSTSQHPTVPNRTQPNRTVPEMTGDVPPVAKATSPRGQQRRVEVDEDFKAELTERFWEAFGSREAVADCIAAAMGYRGATKYVDQRAFLRNWVRSDSEKAALRRRTRNGAASVIEHEPPSKRPLEQHEGPMPTTVPCAKCRRPIAGLQPGGKCSQCATQEAA